MIKCSKCGAECSDKALFCSSCGKSLAEEHAAIENSNKTFKCPSCGTTFKGHKLFCEHCGMKFEWPKDSAPELDNEKIEQKKEFTKGDAKKIGKIILYGFSFLVILLSMISVWLNFGESYGLSNVLGGLQVKANYGLNIYFDEMWKQDATKMTFMPGFLLFIISILSTYIFGIISIVKQIKSGIKKEFEFSPMYMIIIAIFPLFAQLAGLTAVYANETNGFLSVGIGMGSGTILSIVSCSFVFTILVANDLLDESTSTKTITSKIFSYFSAIMIFVGCALAFICTRKISSGTASGSSNISLYIASIWQSLSKDDPAWYYLLAEEFIQMAGLLIAPLVVLYALDCINNKKCCGLTITMSSIFLAVIIAVIVTYAVGKDTLYRVIGDQSLGSGPIVGLILTAVGLGFAITTAALTKEDY